MGVGRGNQEQFEGHDNEAFDAPPDYDYITTHDIGTLHNAGNPTLQV